MISFFNFKDIRVPTRRRDQLALNSDHTHFIIIREQPIGSDATQKTVSNENKEKLLEKLLDSADSATHKFRDRFEIFLHQETLPQSEGEPRTIGKSNSKLIH